MDKFRSAVLVLGGLVIGACVSTLAPIVRANAAGSHRCDYSYIVDTGTPEIGEGGEVHYDADWERVLSDGWTLKTATTGIYVFERCQSRRE